MGTAGGEKRVLAGWAHDLGKPLQVIWSHGRRLAQSDALDRQTRDLALAIVEQRLALTPTENLAAYEAYLLGRQWMTRRTKHALSEAETHFERAIELDPDFALAYVGMADTIQLQFDYAGNHFTARAAATQLADSLHRRCQPLLQGHRPVARSRKSRQRLPRRVGLCNFLRCIAVSRQAHRVYWLVR